VVKLSAAVAFPGALASAATQLIGHQCLNLVIGRTADKSTRLGNDRLQLVNRCEASIFFQPSCLAGLRWIKHAAHYVLLRFPAGFAAKNGKRIETLTFRIEQSYLTHQRPLTCGVKPLSLRLPVIFIVAFCSANLRRATLQRSPRSAILASALHVVLYCDKLPIFINCLRLAFLRYLPLVRSANRSSR